MAHPKDNRRRSLNWRDFFLTPAVEGLLLVLAGLSVLSVHFSYPLSLFGMLIIFMAALFFTTLIFLKVLRLACRFKRGIFSNETNPWIFYGWRLHGLLCSTNLSVAYSSRLLPPFVRKQVYRLLGARIGGWGGFIGGHFLDPYLIRVGAAAYVADDVMFIPHHYAVGTSDLLMLEPIELKDGAVVEARSTLMPGVTIGENSMVKAMSIVTMNTKIPPNEIWGGIPAKKVSDVDKPLSEAFGA